MMDAHVRDRLVHEPFDVIVMLGVGTVENRVDFLRSSDVKTVTIDLETMDSKEQNLWHEPVISYALCSISSSLDSIQCPTFGSIAQDLSEENSLLSELLDLMQICKTRDVTFCGHNINCSHEHLPKIGMGREGYDLPKILDRVKSLGLNGEFVSTLKTFDTMDHAVISYDHSKHSHLRDSGEKKRALGVLDLESDFNIIRPPGVGKMGSRMRQIYTDYLHTRDQATLRDILLYNCVDSISESLISRIFVLCVNECGRCNRLVPPRDRCNRIPSEFKIGEMNEWKQLSSSTLQLR
jgi:hypothetical protein